MSPLDTDPSYTGEEPLLDAFLRDSLPEVKLALGRQIDRENARALPERYAQLLPETVLIVTLRPDAAEALEGVAAQVEDELTDSCMRHGALYDREYRVQLRRAAQAGAALFAVSAHKEAELAQVDASRLHDDEPTSAVISPTSAVISPTMASVRGGAEAPEDAAVVPRETAFDPDATRIEATPPPSGWDSGRWELVVEDLDGEERETFRLAEPVTSIGRRTEDPQLRCDVPLTDAPHVSRRQLSLVWEPAGEDPAFRLYNLGLNSVHVEERAVPGANVKQGELRLESLAGEHVSALHVGEAVRIGESGPVLRVREAGPPPPDPDATQFG